MFHQRSRVGRVSWKERRTMMAKSSNQIAASCAPVRMASTPQYFLYLIVVMYPVLCTLYSVQYSLYVAGWRLRVRVAVSSGAATPLLIPLSSRPVDRRRGSMLSRVGLSTLVQSTRTGGWTSLHPTRSIVGLVYVVHPHRIAYSCPTFMGRLPLR